MFLLLTPYHLYFLPIYTLYTVEKQQKYVGQDAIFIGLVETFVHHYFLHDFVFLVQHHQFSFDIWNLNIYIKYVPRLAAPVETSQEKRQALALWLSRPIDPTHTGIRTYIGNDQLKKIHQRTMRTTHVLDLFNLTILANHSRLSNAHYKGLKHGSYFI